MRGPGRRRAHRFASLVACLALLNGGMASGGECEVEAYAWVGEGGARSRGVDGVRLGDGSYAESLRLVLWSAEERRGLRLRLTLDHRLTPPSFRSDYFGPDGQRRTLEPSRQKACFYTATLEDGGPASTASLNLCRGRLNGMVASAGDVWELDTDPLGTIFVAPAGATEEESSWRRGRRCGFLPRLWAPRLEEAGRTRSSLRRLRRAAATRPAYYDDHLDGQLRYVELTLVNDKSMLEKFNNDLELLTERTKQVANVVNAIYFPLNIRVLLVGVETWSDKDHIAMAEDGDATLNAFLHYRKSRLMATMPSDNSQLLTNRNFETGVVGKALKGTMCSYEMSGGVNVDHHRRVVAVAATVAHEMGHNFGMEHDNDTCDCPGRRCIMSPSSGGTWPPNWSSCSLEYLAHGLAHGADYCLHNVPAAAFGGPFCGNGMVEGTEECDCGTPDNCVSKCCNASTCTLVEGAECSNGACCDQSSCSLRPRTAVCRGEDGPCDLAEFCDGADAECPPDVHQQDGQPCPDGFCGRGRCGQRDRQCKRLWGPSGRSSHPVCYDYNSQGTFQGNCGHDRFNKTHFPKCARKDVLCGRLHCRHENERTEFGFGVVAQTSHTVLRLGTERFAVCSVAMVDLGGPEDPDPGLVPDGAVCGDDQDHMCYKTTCVPPADVRALKACDPPDCNGRGVCNSRGRCHCDYGFGGRGCGIPGEGGSLDSGPSGPGPQGFTVAMGFALFSLVLLLILTVLFLYWKKRKWMANNKVFKYLLPRDEQRRLDDSKPPPPRRKPSIKGRPAPPPPTQVTMQAPVYPASLPGGDTVKLSFSKPPPPIKAAPIAAVAAAPVHQGPMRGASQGHAHYPTSTLPRNPATTYNLYGTRDPNPGINSDGSRNFARSGSMPRPSKPAPPRPSPPKKPPQPAATEAREQTPSPHEEDGLLGEVMSELRKQSRSPVDPMDPAPRLSSPQPPRSKPSPPPEDPDVSTSIHSRRAMFEAKAEGGGQDKAGQGTLRGKPKGALPPPPPPPSTKPSLGRSVSSASSSDGAKSRPRAAPPPPPPASAKPKLTSAPSPAPRAVEEEEEEEENYYDVILTPTEERGPAKPKPPLPSKPPVLASKPAPKPPPKVASLAAKFDAKSGGVESKIV